MTVGPHETVSCRAFIDVLAVRRGRRNVRSRRPYIPVSLAAGRDAVGACLVVAAACHAPRPKTVKFPAFFLLQGLKTELTTPSHTPWWLLLLRSIIFTLSFLRWPSRVMKLSTGLPGTSGDVLIAVDNGWASAATGGSGQQKLT